MSTLFIVATPIGNLEDTTLRAIRVLSDVPVIAAEDTRMTRKLLSHFRPTDERSGAHLKPVASLLGAHHGAAGARLLSYNERNRERQTPAVLAALNAGDVALVSDAGMPGISDPGFHLVEAALAAGHDVVPIPGASALTAAVAASGLPSRRFTFLGFLPRKASDRRKLLAETATRSETIVLFEAPHRVVASLTDLLLVFGDRRVAVCRELTKLHEEIFRGTLSEAAAHFAEPRGEFTIVVEGADERSGEQASELDVDALLRDMKSRGLRAKDAVRQVAELTALPHRDVYKRWLEL